MRFFDWLRSLWTPRGDVPIRQKNSGDATVQVGEMPEGRVQTFHAQVVNNITNNYGSPNAANEQQLKGAMEQPTASDVLGLLDQLEPYGKRAPMVKFMKKTFGTPMVIELNEHARMRTFRYCQKTLADCEAKAQARLARAK